MERGEVMTQCLCGCGQDVSSNTTGRPGKFFSGACRTRFHRTNKDVTKVEDGSVTKLTMLNQIVLGDCRDLIKSIPDASIDLIFTDPPYPREFLPLYGWLAKEAERVLKPGGFLLAYAGGMYKHDVMMHLGKHLTYFWDYLAIDSGPGTPVWPRRTVAHHKSILAYVKGEGKP
jgi:hypothetical protein